MMGVSRLLMVVLVVVGREEGRLAAGGRSACFDLGQLAKQMEVID